MKSFRKFLAFAAATAACISCFAFTACGDNSGNDGDEKQEEVNKIVLTEDTDFAALVSEKLDEAGWKTAFASSTYKDCTVAHYDADSTDNAAFMFLDSTDSKMLSEFKYGENESSHIFYEKTNAALYQYMTFDSATGRPDPEDNFYLYDLSGLVADSEEYAAQVENLAMSYRYVCADFGNFYSNFVYDEEKGSYIFSGRDYCSNTEGDEFYNEDCKGYFDGCDHYDMIETNVGLSYYSNEMHYYAEVKIINGKLAYVYAVISGNQPSKTYFYDFDNTSVTLPEYTETRQPQG